MGRFCLGCEDFRPHFLKVAGRHVVADCEAVLAMVRQRHPQPGETQLEAGRSNLVWILAVAIAHARALARAGVSRGRALPRREHRPG